MQTIATIDPVSSYRGHAAASVPFRVEMVGTAPPPYGGVSVHCERLISCLNKRGISARLWDANGRFSPDGTIVPYDPHRYFRALQGPFPTISHWHHAPDPAALWHTLTSRRSQTPRLRIVMSYYNERLRRQFDESPLLKRLVMRRFMRRCDAAIFPTDDALEQGIEIGHATERCHVVSSFIPPREDASSIDLLPNSVQKFMQQHSPNLSAGGWTIAFHEGIDIYGFDLLVDLVGQLHRRWPQIGMTICLPQHTEGGYLHTLRTRAAALNVSDAIQWVTEPLPEVTPLWRASDVFIRPTCTDGDSLSLREALALGVPCVASDAAVRPVGCHLFRNRDLGALVAVVERLLTSIRDTPRSLTARSDHASALSDGIDAFVKLYSSLATDVSAHCL